MSMSIFDNGYIDSQLNTLLRFKLQPDSYDSILYNFQTAGQPQRLICYQCDVTFKPQPDLSLKRSSLYINNGEVTQTAGVQTTAVCLGHKTEN